MTYVIHYIAHVTTFQACLLPTPYSYAHSSNALTLTRPAFSSSTRPTPVHSRLDQLVRERFLPCTNHTPPRPTSCVLFLTLLFPLASFFSSSSHPLAPMPQHRLHERPPPHVSPRPHHLHRPSMPNFVHLNYELFNQENSPS